MSVVLKTVPVGRRPPSTPTLAERQLVPILLSVAGSSKYRLDPLLYAGHSVPSSAKLTVSRTLEDASRRVRISLVKVGALNNPPRPLFEPSSSIDQFTPKTLDDAGTFQSVRNVVSVMRPKNLL